MLLGMPAWDGCPSNGIGCQLIPQRIPDSDEGSLNFAFRQSPSTKTANSHILAVGSRKSESWTNSQDFGS